MKRKVLKMKGGRRWNVYHNNRGECVINEEVVKRRKERRRTYKHFRREARLLNLRGKSQFCSFVKINKVPQSSHNLVFESLLTSLNRVIVRRPLTSEILSKSEVDAARLTRNFPNVTPVGLKAVSLSPMVSVHTRAARVWTSLSSAQL